MRTYMRLAAGLLAALVAGSASAGGRPISLQPLKKDPPLASLQYIFHPGDVLTYGQVLESENALRDNPQASYRVRLEWQVKMAVLAVEPGATWLAIQYNLRGASVSNRGAFERLAGKDEARLLLEIYDNLEPEVVRILKLDASGANATGSYDLTMASSSIYSFMSRIRRLPGVPFDVGDSFQAREEDALNIVYRGEEADLRGTSYVFTADHPSGRVLFAVSKELGVPERLEYTASYVAENQVRKEGYSFVLREKRNIPWPGLLGNPLVNKALMLAAIARPGLACDRGTVAAFLDSADQGRQNLGAAYCGLRGIPNGLDLEPYLKSPNPIVRFNAAKAFLKFRGEAGPLRALTLDADPYVRNRAVDFFERSSYMIPSGIHPLFLAVQSWLYQDGPMPSVRTDQEDDVHRVLQFLKPANAPLPGFSKNFLADPEDLQHPYYLYIPWDYDPAEVYPAFVYLGMGDGRGDYALNAVVTGLKKAGRLSRYVLLVPQAHGLWWEPSAGEALNRILKTVLRSVSIDTNRICLAGSSNGGMGTMFYGAHLPDRFAALASNMGYPVLERDFLTKPLDLGPLKNLFNAKVFLSHGGSDGHVTPEGDREAYAFLKKGPRPPIYVELPDRGHNIPIADVLARALAVFDASRRDPFPKRIDFTMNEPAYAACYWIAVEEYSVLPARVSARILGNTIDVESSGVRQMRLSLDEGLIDLAKPVIVRINGKELFNGMPQASAHGLLWSAKNRMDAQLGYAATIDLEVEDDAGRF